MKNNGKKPEKAFQDSCEKQGILCIRLVDSNKFGFGEQTRFTPSNVADFVCHNGVTMLLVEAKSTVNTSISFNQPCYEKGSGTYMIKPAQVKSLLKYCGYPNVYPILLLDYADRTNKKGVMIDGGTYAVHIEKFVQWADSTSKKSINKDDAESIGIKVERHKNRVNYRYDITDMIERLKE